MATFTKYQDYIERLHMAVHNWVAAGNQFKGALHSDAPTVATDDELDDLTQPTGTGYTIKGNDIQNDGSEASGTFTATAVDHTWTAGAGDWTAFRYLSIHNEDSTTDKLVASFDYGSNVTPANGETFTADYGASLFTAA